MRRLLVLLLLLSAAAAGQTISRTGSCSAATTSCTFSATATGDLKIIFAFRSGSNTPPTLPAGWTTILTVQAGSGGTTASARIGCNKSSSGSDTGSGTWTNATDVVGASYAGTGVNATSDCNTTGIGGIGSNSAKTSTSLNYPTITMSRANGTSWVMGDSGGTATSGTITCAPSGMTSITTGGTGPQARASDTNATVSSWSSTSCTVASETWVSAVVEVIVPPIGGVRNRVF